MVVTDFIHQFRIAATMLSPWEYESGDFAKADLDDFALRSRHVWWSREAVEGLDPAAFPRLSPSEKAELIVLKDRFLENVARSKFADDSELLAARDALLAIFKIVATRLYNPDVEKAARVLSRLIREPKYGGWLKAFDISFEDDWAGEPAIFVWIVVEDSAPDDPEFRPAYSQFKMDVYQGLVSKGVPDLFVYVKLRTVGEQSEILSGETE